MCEAEVSSESAVCQANSAVNAILERTCKSQKSMWELEEKVTLLSKSTPCESLSILLKTRSRLDVIQDAQKQARNLSEDLLEDQLSLDNVSELSEAERASRKKALALIDKFLEEVDKAKSKLAELAENPEPKKVERIRPTKGSKRKNEASSGDAVTDKCLELAKTISEAARLPADVSTMLSNFIPHCLGQPKEKRHRFQDKAIDAVEKIMRGIDEHLHKMVDESRSKLDTARCQAAPYEAQLNDAKAKLCKDKEYFTQKTKDLANATLEFRSARAARENAQKAQANGDKDYLDAKGQKDHVQAVIDDFIEPLTSGTVLQQDIEERCETLLGILSQLDTSFDEAILQVLRTSLHKAPDARGDFGNMAVDQLMKTMIKHVELQETTLQALEGGKNDRAAQVETCQAAFEVALQKQMSEASVFEAGFESRKNSEAAVEEARRALKDLAAQTKASEKALYEAEANMEVFRDCTWSMFKELKDRPMEQPPQEEHSSVAEAPDAVANH